MSADAGSALAWAFAGVRIVFLGERAGAVWLGLAGFMAEELSAIALEVVRLGAVLTDLAWVVLATGLDAFFEF